MYLVHCVSFSAILEYNSLLRRLYCRGARTASAAQIRYVIVLLLPFKNRSELTTIAAYKRLEDLNNSEPLVQFLEKLEL